jgi:hypothetical protein
MSGPLHTVNATFFGRHWSEHAVLRRYVPTDHDLSVLSFGCSTGEELLTLRTLFPGAHIFGCDVDWHGLQAARALVGNRAVIFESRPNTVLGHGPYDVIVCNSVLLSPSRLEASLWLDAVSLLDAALKPGGILQIINSHIPFRFHPKAASYEPLRSPLLLTPSFVDQFNLEGLRLCTGVTGAGRSAILSRHFGEEGWRQLLPSDFHDIHFLKAGGAKPAAVLDEIVPTLRKLPSWASGMTTYRPSLTDDPRPSTHIEVDVSWTTSGVDNACLDRTMRRIWFDGSVPLTTTTRVDLAGPQGTAFIEATMGKRSSRLAIDALLQAQPTHSVSI